MSPERPRPRAPIAAGPGKSAATTRAYSVSSARSALAAAVAERDGHYEALLPMQGGGRSAEDAEARRVGPGGIESGTQIRLSGEGEPGTHDGPAGDLYVSIRVKAHRLFTREGYDLIPRQGVTVAQAALGATLEVPTLNGDAEVQIPSGTQTGDVIRLRGQGVPILATRSSGATSW